MNELTDKIISNEVLHTGKVFGSNLRRTVISKEFEQYKFIVKCCRRCFKEEYLPNKSLNYLYLCTCGNGIFSMWGVKAVGLRKRLGDGLVICGACFYPFGAKEEVRDYKCISSLPIKRFVFEMPKEKTA